MERRHRDRRDVAFTYQYIKQHHNKTDNVNFAGLNAHHEGDHLG